MRFVLENCNEDDIYELTGCKLDELQAWQTSLKERILKHVNEINMPDKYKK
ncbi:hypothetical protein D3C81_1356550 [compost metagenome]